MLSGFFSSNSDIGPLQIIGHPVYGVSYASFCVYPKRFPILDTLSFFHRALVQSKWNFLGLLSGFFSSNSDIGPLQIIGHPVYGVSYASFCVYPKRFPILDTLSFFHRALVQSKWNFLGLLSGFFSSNSDIGPLQIIGHLVYGVSYASFCVYPKRFPILDTLSFFHRALVQSKWNFLGLLSGFFSSNSDIGPLQIIGHPVYGVSYAFFLRVP